MNIHPIFVHFPVALLTLYAVLELIRFRKVLEQSYWFYVKAVLVIFGALSAGVTYITGDMAGDLITSPDPALARLLEQHETFAIITLVIFGSLGFSYLVAWINRQCAPDVSPLRASASERSNLTSDGGIAESQDKALAPRNGTLQQVWAWLTKLATFIQTPSLLFVLALAGLASITITGGLGGRLAYGSIDPAFTWFYNMFLK